MEKPMRDRTDSDPNKNKRNKIVAGTTSFQLTQYIIGILLVVLILGVVFLGVFNNQPRYNLKVIQESVSREISKVITSYEYISVDHSLHSTVPHVPESRRLRVLVTGGAGFVGSHLVDRYSLCCAA